MNWREMGAKGGRSTRGERKGTAKLTRQAVLEILESEEPASNLSGQFGVCKEHIRAIKRRKWWQHVV